MMNFIPGGVAVAPSSVLVFSPVETGCFHSFLGCISCVRHTDFVVL